MDYKEGIPWEAVQNGMPHALDSGGRGILFLSTDGKTSHKRLSFALSSLAYTRWCSLWRGGGGRSACSPSFLELPDRSQGKGIINFFLNHNSRQTRGDSQGQLGIVSDLSRLVERKPYNVRENHMYTVKSTKPTKRGTGARDTDLYNFLTYRHQIWY